MIICEIGQNHCGNPQLARYLISEAKKNGGDLVKFQLYSHKDLYKDRPDIPDVALSFEQAKAYFEFGKEIGIEAFFSVFDVERVKWCEKIGVKRYKIACNGKSIKLIKAIKETRKKIYVSFYGNFDSNMPFSTRLWGDVWFYCVPKYPTKLSDICFPYFQDGYYGFSDHTIGLDAAKIAFARGAEIVEKHFAVDHKTGVDAEWSMTPDELKELKTWENTCKVALGVA